MPQKVNKKLLNAFGARIRELRLARGLAQEQQAEVTGFSVFAGQETGTYLATKTDSPRFR